MKLNTQRLAQKIAALGLFALCLLPFALSAQTNVILVDVADYGLAPQRGVNVTFTLLWPNPRTAGGALIRQDPVTHVTGANGRASFTNILWGIYRLDVAGLAGTRFPLYVGTNTTGTVSAAALVTNSAALPPDTATNYYTRAQVDALLASAGGGTATNLFVKNVGGSATNLIMRNAAGAALLYPSFDGSAVVLATNLMLAPDASRVILYGGNLELINSGLTATNGVTAGSFTVESGDQAARLGFEENTNFNLEVNGTSALRRTVTGSTYLNSSAGGSFVANHPNGDGSFRTVVKSGDGVGEELVVIDTNKVVIAPPLWTNRFGFITNHYVEENDVMMYGDSGALFPLAYGDGSAQGVGGDFVVRGGNAVNTSPGGGSARGGRLILRGGAGVQDPPEHPFYSPATITLGGSDDSQDGGDGFVFGVKPADLLAKAGENVSDPYNEGGAELFLQRGILDTTVTTNVTHLKANRSFTHGGDLVVAGGDTYDQAGSGGNVYLAGGGGASVGTVYITNSTVSFSNGAYYFSWHPENGAIDAVAGTFSLGDADGTLTKSADILTWNGELDAQLVAANWFAGDGAGLTDLNAANITVGTLAAARFPYAIQPASAVLSNATSLATSNAAAVLYTNSVLRTNNLAGNPPAPGALLGWLSGTQAAWLSNLTWDTTNLTLKLPSGSNVFNVNTNGTVAFQSNGIASVVISNGQIWAAGQVQIGPVANNNWLSGANGQQLLVKFAQSGNAGIDINHSTNIKIQKVPLRWSSSAVDATATTYCEFAPGINAGEISVGTNLYARGTLTATNGIASYSTNSTLFVAATGITNTLAVAYVVAGFTGTGVGQTNASGYGFARGTINTPTDITLQPGAKLLGTGCAAAGAYAW